MSETRCRCGRYEVFGTPASLFDGKFHSPSICEAFPPPEVDAATLAGALHGQPAREPMGEAEWLLSRYHITPRAPQVSEREKRREEAARALLAAQRGSPPARVWLDNEPWLRQADLLLAREDAAWNAGVRAAANIHYAPESAIIATLLRPEVTP